LVIGVDIVDIDRFSKVIDRTSRLMYRLFTVRELDYCLSKKNRYASLAARFAAKEATRKLIPKFCTQIRFQDVEIIRDEYGGPQIVLHNSAYNLLATYGIKDLALSISHAQNQAIAVVVAGKDD